MTGFFTKKRSSSSKRSLYSGMVDMFEGTLSLGNVVVVTSPKHKRDDASARNLDAQAIANDWSAVGQDLRNAMAESKKKEIGES